MKLELDQGIGDIPKERTEEKSWGGGSEKTLRAVLRCVQGCVLCTCLS